MSGKDKGSGREQWNAGPTGDTRKRTGGRFAGRQGSTGLPGQQPEPKVKAVLQTLRHWPGIEYVEPHYIIRLEAEPGAIPGTGIDREGATPLGKLTVAGADIAAYLTWETQPNWQWR